MWYIKRTPPWYVDRDVSIRNSLRPNCTSKYDTSTRCTYSSLDPLVPGAAYLVYQAGSTCSRARYQQRELLSTWYDLVRYMQAPNRLYKSEVRGSISRVKLLLGRDYLIARTCCKQSKPLPHATVEKAKRSFPMERGPTAKHHPAWNPRCTQ